MELREKRVECENMKVVIKYQKNMINYLNVCGDDKQDVLHQIQACTECLQPYLNSIAEKYGQVWSLVLNCSNDFLSSVE